MYFIRKIFDSLNIGNRKNIQNENLSPHNIEQYAKECNAYVLHEEQKEQNHSSDIDELSLSELNDKIDRVNELAANVRKTIDKEEFYDFMEEIENTLTELSKYEQKFDFAYPPSANLRDLRRHKSKLIENLKKRITEKENTQSYTENTENFKNSITVGDNDIQLKSDFIYCTKPIEKTNDTFALDKENIQERKLFKYNFPPVSLLDKRQDDIKENIKERAMKLVRTFEVFGINASIVDILRGARFTRFEVQIGQGVRIKDVFNIKDDIQLSLATPNLSIEAPIAGKTTIGIDAENNNLSTVTLREIIESEKFCNSNSNLTIAIGKDITGNIIVENLENMLHLLIAGTTGSGKSVFINSIIMSILYKANPTEVKLVLIDTKSVNFSVYNGIPHLLVPVITDLRKVSATLQWGIAEMNDRYKKFADSNVKDLKGYNKASEEGKFSIWGEVMQKLPSIVIIIDDFSDLMPGYNNEVEESICRLAQMGRAAGIHLIISTQRPSVDVITGIIKANIPSRIAFNVFSAIDSRTIIDAKGAEKLLGSGDMLLCLQGKRTPSRIQGTFVSDSEVSDVVDFLKNQMLGNTAYSYDIEEKIQIMYSPSGIVCNLGAGNNSGIDTYFAEAGKLVIEKEKASIGMLQRVFKIGFNRAARIVDQLEDAGVVGAEYGTKPREILMSIEQFELLLREKYNN